MALEELQDDLDAAQAASEQALLLLHDSERLVAEKELERARLCTELEKARVAVEQVNAQ